MAALELRRCTQLDCGTLLRTLFPFLMRFAFVPQLSWCFDRRGGIAWGLVPCRCLADKEEHGCLGMCSECDVAALVMAALVMACAGCRDV